MYNPFSAFNSLNSTSEATNSTQKPHMLERFQTFISKRGKLG
jgi:hypothetical protein